MACSYVYERATQYEVPIVTSDLCRKTLEERVAMELSDYFSDQWKQLGEDIQRKILSDVRKVYKKANDVLVLTTDTDTDTDTERQSAELSPSIRRALSRSGLQGADGLIAPIAVYWLLSTFDTET